MAAQDAASAIPAARSRRASAALSPPALRPRSQTMARPARAARPGTSMGIAWTRWAGHVAEVRVDGAEPEGDLPRPLPGSRAVRNGHAASTAMTAQPSTAMLVYLLNVAALQRHEASQPSPGPAPGADVGR